MVWVKQREKQDSKKEDKLRKSTSIHGDAKYEDITNVAKNDSAFESTWKI